MKKGFTLIELLAVIVILAIILAISIPTVSKLIENSRESAFKTSIRSIYNLAERTAVSNGIESGNISDLNLSGEKSFGYWEYNPTTKEVYLCNVSNKDYVLNSTLSLSDFSPSGRQDCIKSNKKNENYNVSMTARGTFLLSDIFNNNNLGYGKISTVSSNTYIIDNDNTAGTEPRNFISYSGIIWRAYKMNSNGVALISNNGVADKPFDTGGGSTFSSSSITTYLNTTFYTSLSNNSIIKQIAYSANKYNSSTGALISTASATVKVALIDLVDYKVLYTNTDLNNGGICTNPNYNNNEAGCTSHYSCYINDIPSFSNFIPQYTDEPSCLSTGGVCYSSDWSEIWTQYENDPDGCNNEGGYYWNNNMWSTDSFDTNFNHYLKPTTNVYWMINGSELTYQPFYAHYYGHYSRTDTSTPAEIRPVITLNSNTSIISGNGTSSNPYIIQ